MLADEIIGILEKNKDTRQAEKMAAYMKNKFEFLGIPKPILNELMKTILKGTAKQELDWNFVFGLWNCKWRESQYVALEYLKKHRRQFVPTDISNLKQLIVEKSWWETVDTIDAFVGDLVLIDENLKAEMLMWAVSDNIWLRRVAIDFQQEYKEKTDKELLEKIIVMNLGSDEFFINKAIGWSLRDYSKVNSEWVKEFISKYRANMSALSIKEAEKYL